MEQRINKIANPAIREWVRQQMRLALIRGAVNLSGDKINLLPQVEAELEAEKKRLELELKTLDTAPPTV